MGKMNNRPIFTIEIGDLQFAVFPAESLKTAQALLDKAWFTAPLLSIPKVERHFAIFQTLHVRAATAEEAEHWHREFAIAMTDGRADETDSPLVFLKRIEDWGE